MPAVNWLGSVVGGLVAFIVGGLWYSPAVLGTAWLTGIGKSPEELTRDARPGLTYGLSLVASILSAVVFSMFLGPTPALAFAVGAGVSTGLIWVGGSFAMSYLFERRPVSLWLINTGYHTIQFAVIGAALALI